MTEQEINNLIDSKIGKTKMSQLPEATQTSGLYSIGYTGNQSVKYKANLLQGDPLTVRKTYQTEAEALADKNPIDTTTSLPLKVGQFVSIVDDGEKNGIYRISSISGDGTMSLELQGKLGDLSDYANHGYDSNPKTLKEVDDTVSEVKNDLIKFVLGEDIDLETKPALTDGYYINSQGFSVSTTSYSFSATLDFIPLYGAKKLHYFGSFGGASTRLAFYSGTSDNSMVLAVPQSNRLILDEVLDIPVEAKYYRATCAISGKNDFKVVLIGVGSSLKLQSFRYVGTPVYENDAIKQSNIIWNDGSSGAVTFNNWNEENLTFTSFVATSIENGVTVTQPPVTFNSNNQITNYPNFIISEI